MECKNAPNAKKLHKTKTILIILFTNRGRNNMDGKVVGSSFWDFIFQTGSNLIKR
jgi:hypothetical protein